MRTTGVELIAKTGQFKREMRDSGRVIRDVATEADKLGVSGTKMGTQLSKGSRTGGAGLDELAGHADNLKRKIAETEAGIRSLAKGFASTGDAGILKEIGKQQRFLGQLRKVDNLLPKPAELVAAGTRMGTQVGTGFGSSLRSVLPAAVNPAMVAAGAGMAATLAPFLGAAVAGAVVGGAAVGGVVGGLVLAARDPRVKAAGTQLGQEMLASLEHRATAFIGPALGGVEKVRGAWADFDDDLDRIFADSAGFVDPLIDGLLSGALKVGHGFADAVGSADPVVAELGRTMDRLGGAGGAFLTEMSQHADEGARAIESLTDATVGFIDVTTDVVGGLATMYGWYTKVNDKVTSLTNGLSIFRVMNPVGPLKDLISGFRGTDEAAGGADQAVRQVAGSALVAGDAMAVAAEDTNAFKVATEGLKVNQKALTFAQDELTRSIQGMGPVGGQATMVVDNLRKATSALYGAQIQATDANEGYEASWDSLSESVRANKSTLDIHSAAGRTNRNALQDVLIKTNELFFAEIATGKSVADATKKHQNRIAAIKEEARRLGLNKTATQELINTYGAIPKKKETDLILDGVREVVSALNRLYIYQRALATGKSISSVEDQMRKGNDSGPSKGGGGFHAGGWTGPGGEFQRAGDVHADEFVIKKRSRRKIERQQPGLLDEMNATGQVPAGYAVGGRVAPVDTSRRWPFPTDVSGTHIISRAQAAANVTPAFGNWPSSPSAQRGDSGVWRGILNLIRGTGPMSGSFGNAYRAGDPKWHGSGRAVDWMGYGQDRLASFLANRRPLELIHRTNQRDYAYTRGVNKGSFNNALMEAHRNHIHIAMANGGVIREPVYGVGASGASYSFGERGVPEVVMPMTGGSRGGGGTTITYNIAVSVPATVNKAEVGREVVSAIQAFESGSGKRWRS